MPLSRQTVYLIWMLWLFSFSQSKVNGSKPYRMEEMCGETVIMMNESIYTGDIHFTFQPAMYTQLRDCEIYVEGWSSLGNKINFYFIEFQLMDDCIRNRTRVTVSEIDGASPDYVGYVAGFPAYVCGSGSGIVGRAFSTTFRYLAVRFQTSYKYHTSEFSMVFNVFNEAPCPTYEHSCDNHRCISKDLTCNDRNPCGDHSDCKNSVRKNSGLSTGQIAGGIVVGVTVLFAIALCLYCARKKILKARVERRDDSLREEFHQIAPSRSNRDTRTTGDRSDQEIIELRVELPDTRTNRRNSPAQSSSLPPSYESLEQIPGSSGAQTIPEIHPAATDARSSNGHDVNTSSPYNSREHLNADDTRLRQDHRLREEFHQIAPSRSNRDTRTTGDRSDQENIELRVELPETRTNRRNSPAQSSSLPPSYESLEQIPGSSGAQTMPEIHPAATNTRSCNGHGVNTSSPYNSREHLNADDTRLPRSDGAGNGQSRASGATAHRIHNGTEPHYPAVYVAPPPEYITAVTYSEEYKVTPPSCSDV